MRGRIFKELILIAAVLVTLCLLLAGCDVNDTSKTEAKELTTSESEQAQNNAQTENNMPVDEKTQTGQSNEGASGEQNDHQQDHNQVEQNDNQTNQISSDVQQQTQTEETDNHASDQSQQENQPSQPTTPNCYYPLYL